MWVKAIVLIPRKDGVFHLDEAKVFKRYGAFLRYKVKNKHVPSETHGDSSGVVVDVVLGAPTKIDGDFGEFNVLLTWEHVENFIKALAESDSQTAKLTGKREWGGKRPYTSTWLEHYV